MGTDSCIWPFGGRGVARPDLLQTAQGMVPERWALPGALICISLVLACRVQPGAAVAPAGLGWSLAVAAMWKVPCHETRISGIGSGSQQRPSEMQQRCMSDHGT